MLCGCIEAGGTKFNLAVGNEKGELINFKQIPTETPEVTMAKVIEYFKDYSLDTIGLGCFGPIDLIKESETYGFITTTPKLAWQNYNIVGALKKYFPVPVGFDTDVNGACLGEKEYGCAKGLNNVLYITVGTGIGAGAIAEGALVHGMLHPEMGHIIVRRHPDDTFAGSCAYHKDCLEGLASGTAVAKRYNKKGEALIHDAKVWDLEGYYIAQAIVNYLLVLSPEKIIIGGGIGQNQEMVHHVRHYVRDLLNGYLKTKQLEDLDNYIVNPGLKDEAGIYGALALGLRAK